jgi:hypothetical protein
MDVAGSGMSAYMAAVGFEEGSEGSDGWTSLRGDETIIRIRCLASASVGGTGWGAFRELVVDDSCVIELPA